MAADHVRGRLHEVDGLWNELVDATNRKGAKLREAGDEQQFNRNIEDVELWLSELEGQVATEDYGKDLVSVQNLQKKMTLLESDYHAHGDRIDGIKNLAKKFNEEEHFNAPVIVRKQEALLSRYDVRRFFMTFEEMSFFRTYASLSRRESTSWANLCREINSSETLRMNSPGFARRNRLVRKKEKLQ